VSTVGIGSQSPRPFNRSEHPWYGKTMADLTLDEVFDILQARDEWCACKVLHVTCDEYHDEYGPDYLTTECFSQHGMDYVTREHIWHESMYMADLNPRYEWW
jgi:hypothetical protein